jgi:hypothetical protein
MQLKYASLEDSQSPDVLVHLKTKRISAMTRFSVRVLFQVVTIVAILASIYVSQNPRPIQIERFSWRKLEQSKHSPRVVLITYRHSISDMVLLPVLANPDIQLTMRKKGMRVFATSVVDPLVDQRIHRLVGEKNLPLILYFPRGRTDRFEVVADYETSPAVFHDLIREVH